MSIAAPKSDINHMMTLKIITIGHCTGYDCFAFQWLVVDRKALLKEQQPFDAKKDCWIPDEKDGFSRGEIVSTKGDDVTVLHVNSRLVSPYIDMFRNVNRPKK